MLESRFVPLLCHNRLERTVSNERTGHRFVTTNDELIFNYGKDTQATADLVYRKDSHYLQIEPLTCEEARKHFPQMCSDLGQKTSAQEPEHGAYPTMAGKISTFEVYKISRQQWQLVTHATARQTDEMIRERSVHGLEHLDSAAKARRKDPLMKVLEDDDAAAQAGRMRPPQHKSHHRHQSPYDYEAGEHLSIDPIGPFKVMSPGGFDCLMIYGDKRTTDLSAQGFIQAERWYSLYRARFRTDFRYPGVCAETLLAYC